MQKKGSELMYTDEYVILVDEHDRTVGSMEKMEAHRLGRLHRAISVFVFDKEKRLLLQQRALHKYHSPGLWTNTCCTHPRPGETAMAAAHRRLDEEMGLQTNLTFAFTFRYRAEFENGLTEHELDHVFVARHDLLPVTNPDEVAAFRWVNLNDLDQEIMERPETFTAWFKLIYRQAFQYIM